MAQQQDSTLEKIRAYSTTALEQRDEPMELDASHIEARLAQTVRALQVRVEEQQAALETVGWTDCLKGSSTYILHSCVRSHTAKLSLWPTHPQTHVKDCDNSLQSKTRTSA